MSHPTHSALESFEAQWSRLKCIAWKEGRGIKTCSTLQRDTYSLNSGQGEGQRGDITELQTLLGHLGGIAPYLIELNGKAELTSKHVQLARVTITVVQTSSEHIHPFLHGPVLPAAAPGRSKHGCKGLSNALRAKRHICRWNCIILRLSPAAFFCWWAISPASPLTPSGSCSLGKTLIWSARQEE